ncbi:MAG: hypothetical protein IKY39_03085, partial [Clostridia bacterium]|nr:hypothetical protein [Clostridia bacterium]
GGEIRDNKAENGAGIYWESQNNLCVYGGVIAANEAQENGGGIYGTDWGNMYFGGDAIVSGNTDKYSENNNLYLDDDDVYVNLTAGQSEDIPNVPFRAGASIGISAYDTQALISGSDSCFGWEDLDYFFSDRDMYFLRKDYEADGGNNAYKLYIDIIANKPVTEPVMSVTVKDGATLDFTDFDEGWSYALKQSLTMPTTIKLLADWYSENGDFDYARGTEEGYFYLDDNYVITIDLNGHKIDRNLKEPKEDGVIFWLYDYDAKLTIKDSAGGGVITGANNDGNGGAFFVERGSLYIEGGEIRDNKAENGAGIYWESQNELCVYGGVITANEAQEFGGGIYGTDWGDMYFGGNAVVSGNIDKHSENNNLYLDDDDVYVNLTAGQSEDIPNIPFAQGASIGISAYNPQSLISGSDSCFGWNDRDYFFSDSDKYYIRRAYDAGGENNEYKLYIDSIENIPEPAPEVMSVAVKGGITQGFGSFEEGWAYAVKQSISKPTTITLLADWTAENGMFVCLDEFGDEYGSEDGYLYLDDNCNLVIDLNGHKIDRNLSESTDDGVIFWLYDYDAKLTIKDSVGGGVITGANNDGNGGAFFVERGSLYIEGGEITGNKAENGAGIYWESQNDLYVYGGKITDNTANTNGGGIYLTDWGNAYFGGSIVVDGNTGGAKNDNVYLSDEDTVINYAGGQNGSYHFTENAKIGLACYDIVHYKPLNDADSGLDADSIQHFVMDDDKYFIDSVYDFENGVYNFSVAYNLGGRMYVTTYNSKKTFNDLGKGWVYALQMSMETPTTITLESDWIHYSDIGFYYLDEDGSEYGTDNGRLYLNDSDINLTIDLNGHSIIRNVTSPVENGQVFYMGAGSLTITDTSESKNGIITGGNSVGNGGGFYVDGGSLHLKGGSIAENNTLKYGGGIYIDGAELFLEGGSVSDNRAYGQGGGIYVNDATLTIEDGEISRNYAGSSGGGVYCYQYSTVYMNGGTVADNTSEAAGGGFSISVDNLLMHMTGGSILRNLALDGGGGIYWYCDGNLVLTGGVITENHDGYGYNDKQHINRGGGVYAYHYDGDSEIGSDPYIGGDIKIYNNFSSISSENIFPSWSGVNVVESNLYLAENSAKVKQALGQEDDIPNVPLTDGANVGISREYKDVITNDDSMFDEASLKYLHSDADNYYIDAVPDNDYYRLSLVKQSGIIAYNKNRKEIVADIKEAGKYLV